MAKNDELTGRQMCELLHEKWPNLDVSISTIKQARQSIGWVSTRPEVLSTCQGRKYGKETKLVQTANFSKR